MRTRTHDRAIIPQLLWLSTPYFVRLDFRACFIRQISILVNSFCEYDLNVACQPRLGTSNTNVALRTEVLFVWLI